MPDIAPLHYRQSGKMWVAVDQNTPYPTTHVRIGGRKQRNQDIEEDDRRG
jgi:hypothetical protein